MKLTFLGTSHGVPEPGRKRSCSMLQVADKVYFIDMGTQTMPALVDRGIEPRDTRAIFVTHMHGDHTAGLIDFVELASWYYTDCDPQIFLPKLAGVEPIRQWLALSENPLRDGIVFAQVEEGPLFDDGYLKVTAYRTRHTAVSFAYLVEAQGKKLLFTGDLKNPGVDLPRIAYESHLDALICEAAHFPVTDYISCLQKCRIDRVFVNHANPIRLAGLQQMQEALAPVPVVLASDDQEVSF